LRHRYASLAGATAGGGLGILFLILHAIHLASLSFTPQTNAYGSIYFVLSWTVDLVVLISLGLTLPAALRLWSEGEHWELYLRLHVQMAAHVAYFTAAVAAIVYATLYVSPRLI
jgi:heme/copper-type cytochrome/quinol oxidase subunit 3